MNRAEDIYVVYSLAVSKIILTNEIVLSLPVFGKSSSLWHSA